MAALRLPTSPRRPGEYRTRRPFAVRAASVRNAVIADTLAYSPTARDGQVTRIIPLRSVSDMT